MLEEKEQILWEAHVAINDALRLVGRDELIDFLAESTRKELFSGYVLQEHYDCLKSKYQILKSSHGLQHDALMRTAWAS